MSKAKPVPKFTIDDLLVELSRNDVPDGMTVREMCKAAGLDDDKANLARVGNKVHDLVRRGEWECVGNKPTRTIANRNISVPAYRPKNREDSTKE